MDHFRVWHLGLWLIENKVNILYNITTKQMFGGDVNEKYTFIYNYRKTPFP